MTRVTESRGRPRDIIAWDQSHYFQMPQTYFQEQDPKCGLCGSILDSKNHIVLARDPDMVRLKGTLRRRTNGKGA